MLFSIILYRFYFAQVARYQFINLFKRMNINNKRPILKNLSFLNFEGSTSLL